MLYNGRSGSWAHDSQNNTIITGDNSAPCSEVDAGGYGKNRWENYTLNFNLRHQFNQEGRELTFDADYSNFESRAGNDYFNYFFNGEKQQVIDPNILAELTDALGESVTLNESFERDYFSLFPSVSLSHSIKEDHQLSYSYSRRINRPSYQDLNPFIYFLDQFTFGRGNTNLGPEFADNFGINYGYKGRYMINLSYGHTTDAIQEVLEQDDEQKVTFQTYRNLATFRNYSITLSAPVNFAEWWNARVNFSGFLNQVESPFSNEAIDKDQTSYNLNVSNNFQLPGDIKAQLSGNYQSKMLWGIFEIDPRWSLDLGFRKSIWNGKRSVRLNVNDIFNTNQTYINIDQGTMNLDISNIRESRRANITLTYNFGNKEVKPARRRSTATEEEQNRVKSGN